MSERIQSLESTRTQYRDFADAFALLWIEPNASAQNGQSSDQLVSDFQPPLDFTSPGRCGLICCQGTMSERF